MTPRELERLLGGYAAGNLSESERGELLRVSLEDQQLFDALADEEALRDALADPVFRARMRARLEPEEKKSWLFGWPLAAMGAVAGAVVLAVMLTPREGAKVQQVAQSAKQEKFDSLAAPAPAAAPSEPAARKAKVAEPKRAEPELRAQAGASAREFLEEAPKDQAKKALSDEARLNTVPAPIITATPAAPAPPPPPPAAAPARPLERAMERDQRSDRQETAAIDVRLERERGASFEPVRAADLVDGDRVRLQVTPSARGTLEVVWAPAEGAARLEGAVVEAGRTYAVPVAGAFAPGSGGVVVRAAMLPEGAAQFGYRARQSVGAVAGAAAPPAASASSDLKKAEEKESGAVGPVVLKLEFRRP